MPKGMRRGLDRVDSGRRSVLGEQMFEKHFGAAFAAYGGGTVGTVGTGGLQARTTNLP